MSPSFNRLRDFSSHFLLEHLFAIAFNTFKEVSLCLTRWRLLCAWIFLIFDFWFLVGKMVSIRLQRCDIIGIFDRISSRGRQLSEGRRRRMVISYRKMLSTYKMLIYECWRSYHMLRIEPSHLGKCGRLIVRARKAEHLNFSSPFHPSTSMGQHWER